MAQYIGVVLESLSILNPLFLATGFAAGIFLILAAPLFLIAFVRWIALMLQSKRKVLCTTCGHEGALKKRLAGSALIELLCWLLWAPGIIYSAWR